MSAVEFQSWWAHEYPDDAAAECDLIQGQSDQGWSRERMIQDYMDGKNVPLTAEEEAEFDRESADWPAVDRNVTDREIAEASVGYCFVGGA
jgi:hypothetical protein